MFKKILKWSGIAIGSLLIIVLLGFAVVYFNVERRMTRKYSFTPNNITISMDSLSVAKGHHLATIKGCFECHGSNLSGGVILDNFPMGRLVARNITRGTGGLSADFSSTDWLMALQHGVDPSGRPLLLMPSHETTLMSREDLSCLIAYCSQVAPVNNIPPQTSVGPIARVLTFFDKIDMLSVEKIDHTRELTNTVDTTDVLSYGKYLAVSCSGCHTPSFKGGKALAPGFPPSANITSTGNIGHWTEDQFIHTLRTGERTNSTPLNNEYMPWKMTSQYSTHELVALYTYLKSLQ